MPVTTSIKKNIGESGYADVRPGKNVVRIQFDNGTGYEIPADQWDKNRAGGRYNVTMDKNGTKVIGLRPIAGSYIFEFDGMGNRVNELPEPKKQQGGPRQTKDGSKQWFQADSLNFVCVLSVQSEGKYKDLKIYHNVPYIFSPSPGGTGTQLLASGKNELERVGTFLKVNGFDLASEDIPFSTNVLPWLERRLLEVKRPFLGTIGENGFLSSVAELPLELMTPKKKSK